MTCYTFVTMKASVITIGNEILKGRTINTNAAEIGRILYFSGYDIVRGIVVPDSREEIGWAFRTCLEISDVIVSSGGLGPTFDDMTVESFAAEFNIELTRSDEIYNKIKSRYEKRGMKMTEERLKMALVPKGSTLIQNGVGSAPGIEFKINGVRIFILPGVPREMRPMMEKIGEKIKVNDSVYIEESITVKGIPESAVAPITKELMNKYEGKVYIKSHPDISQDGDSILEIEVSTKSKSHEEGQSLVRKVLGEISDKTDVLLEQLSKLKSKEKKRD